MNTRTVSVISLGVILVLVGIIGYLVYGMRLATPAPQAGAHTVLVTNVVKQIAVRKINATNLLGLMSRVSHWSVLESTNYPTYVANLRGFGCPEETVQDIIIADVARVYAKRRLEVRKQYPVRNYWQTEYGYNESNSKLQQQLQDLDQEQRALIKELLGVDLDVTLAKYTGDETPDKDYSFLPAEKQEQLRALQSRYEEMEEQIYQRSQGMMLDEDIEAIKNLQRQRETELAGILTPEELEEFQLRHSPVAENLRSQLTGFGASEEEFRRLFKVYQKYDLQLNQGLDMTDDAQFEIRAQAQEQAQEALEAEARKILGEQRYAEKNKAQDPDYRALLQISERYEMPRENVNKIYEMKMAAEQQRMQLEVNPNLTEEQRQAGMTAIARTTERAVAEMFGDPRRYNAYRKAAGQWLQNLSEMAPQPVEELAQ